MTMSEGDLAVMEIKFVRGATIAARPAPAAMTGALGWLRANLLSSPFNIALTILIALLLAWAIPDLVKFLLIDAVWTGADRAMLAVRLGALVLFRLRFLPDPGSLARRRLLRHAGDRRGLAALAGGATP